MGKILLLLFTVVPLVELWLLLWIGDRVGFWPTVGIVLATGLVGATLAKAEGLRVVQRWQEATSRGQMPEEGVLGGLLVLVGGVFLITPGVLTDVTGLLLLFPPTRRLVAGFVRRRFERGLQNGAGHVLARACRSGLASAGGKPAREARQASGRFRCRMGLAFGADLGA